MDEKLEKNPVYLDTKYIKQEIDKENDSIIDYYASIKVEEHQVQDEIKKECNSSKTPSNNIDPQQAIKQEIDSPGDDYNHIVDNEPCSSKPSTKTSCNNSYNYHNYTSRIMPRKDLQCEYCDYSAVNKISLKWHLQLHLKSQEHQCFYCDKRFARKNNLVNHQKIHIGEKLFQCNHCDKNYILKVNLTRHQTTVHTKEAAFECRQCHKCFKCSQTLLKHHRSVHTTTTIAKPFQCSVCKKNFAHEVNLIEHHHRSHSGEPISMQPL